MHWLITDLGFSIPVDDDAIVFSSRRRGTETYRAPELVSNGEVSRKLDIWAFGCVLLRVASMKMRRAFLYDNLAVVFKEHPEIPVPQLDPAHNGELLETTLCPDSGQLVPFYQQINSILEICFAREPRDRATASQLKTRFEKIRDALIGTQVVPSSHTSDLHYDTKDSGQENKIKEDHVINDQTLPISLEEDIS
jgi:serine/threonine protein kinase